MKEHFINTEKPRQNGDTSHGIAGRIQESSSTLQPIQDDNVSHGTTGMTREDLEKKHFLVANTNQTTVNYSSKNVKEKEMSFVGLVFHKDCIIAFGDSKSTKYDVNNNPYEEVGRTVTKLIKGSDYIGVAYGNNKIRVDCGDCIKETPVEDWIRENMPCSYDEMMVKLHLCLLKEDRLVDRNVPFYFYFGEKHGIRNKAVYYEISDSTFIKHVSYHFNETLVWGGNSEYGNHYDFFPERLLSKNENEIKTELEACIRWRDTFSGKYNPVGGEVFVEKYICKDLQKS